MNPSDDNPRQDTAPPSNDGAPIHQPPQEHIEPSALNEEIKTGEPQQPMAPAKPGSSGGFSDKIDHLADKMSDIVQKWIDTFSIKH